MRASFKAVQDNRQVAMLVPTTLLAQQHYENFSKRFAAFPVRIGILSRFQNPKEVKHLLSELASGVVDIVQSVALQHVILNTLGELTQFCEGLNCLGVKDTLSEHKDLMRPFFCTDSKQRRYVNNILGCKFCVERVLFKLHQG